MYLDNIYYRYFRYIRYVQSFVAQSNFEIIFRFILNNSSKNICLILNSQLFLKVPLS